MSVYESEYAKLNVQLQIINKMIEENEQKLNKECIDTIDKILDNDFSSKYLYMVEFLKQWKTDIEEDIKKAVGMIDIQKKMNQVFR